MKHNVYRFTVKRSRVSETPSEQISGPNAVASFARQLIGELDRECFLTFYLNARHELIGYENTAVGSQTSVEVHPREVFKGAILAGAAAIAIAHNHPSGNCEPSENDRDVTARIGEAGELLGIPLLDHVIVTEDDWYSFRSAAAIDFPKVLFIGD